MRDIRVGAVQFEHAPGDKKTNLGKIMRFSAPSAPFNALTRRARRISVRFVLRYV